MFSPYSIHLGEFDESFFGSLEEASEIAEPTIATLSNYHTVFVDNEKAGIVGILKPITGGVDSGFVQIVLSPYYRGRGLLPEIYELLAEAHKLKTLYATIKKSNGASIRAHEKIGFKILPEEKLKFLHDKKLISEDEVRLEKNYQF